MNESPEGMTAHLRARYPNLPALFAAVRHRPGLFLGTTTISGLGLLLAGIDFAEDFHAVPAGSRLGGFDFGAFERWVESSHNPQRWSHNSFSLAEQVGGSPAAGFDLWFRWYDEFTRSAVG